MRQLVVVAGDEQEVPAGAALPVPLTVIALDQDGHAVSGVDVGFAVMSTLEESGDLAGGLGAGGWAEDSATTSTLGLASVTAVTSPSTATTELALRNDATGVRQRVGLNQFRASAEVCPPYTGCLAPVTVDLDACAFPGEQAGITVTGPSGLDMPLTDVQTELMPRLPAAPLTVRVSDAAGNRVAGAPVVFEAEPQGAGVLARGVAATNQPSRNLAFDLDLAGERYGPAGVVLWGPGRRQAGAIVVATDPWGLAEAPVFAGNTTATAFAAIASLDGLPDRPFTLSTASFDDEAAEPVPPLGVARDYFLPVVGFARPHRPAVEAGVDGEPHHDIDQLVAVLREDVEYDDAGQLALEDLDGVPGPESIRGNRTIKVSRREFQDETVHLAEDAGAGALDPADAVIDAVGRARSVFTAGSAPTQTVRIAAPGAYSLGIMLNTGVLPTPPATPSISRLPPSVLTIDGRLVVPYISSPYGDPATNPNPTNELVFDAADPGLLTGNAKAAFTIYEPMVPADVVRQVQQDLDSKLSWMVTGIPGAPTEFYWTGRAQDCGATKLGLGLGAGFRMERLPASNDDFGPKTLHLRFSAAVPLVCAPSSVVDSQDFEIFFDKNATNHPPAGDLMIDPAFRYSVLSESMPLPHEPDSVVYDTSEPPNWFYYWRQAITTYAGLLFEPAEPWESAQFLAETRYDATMPSRGTVAHAMAGKFWTTWTGAKETTVYGSLACRSEDAAESDCGKDRAGIDLFLLTLYHESRHVQSQVLAFNSPINEACYPGQWSDPPQWPPHRTLQPNMAQTGFTFADFGAFVHEDGSVPQLSKGAGSVVFNSFSMCTEWSIPPCYEPVYPYLYRRYGAAGPMGIENDSLIDADLDGVCDYLEDPSTICEGADVTGMGLDTLPAWDQDICRGTVEMYPLTARWMDEYICEELLKEEHRESLWQHDWAAPGKRHQTEKNADD